MEALRVKRNLKALKRVCHKNDQGIQNNVIEEARLIANIIPIGFKVEQLSKNYEIIHGNFIMEGIVGEDRPMHCSSWAHPAETVEIRNLSSIDSWIEDENVINVYPTEANKRMGMLVCCQLQKRKNSLGKVQTGKILIK